MDKWVSIVNPMNLFDIPICEGMSYEIGQHLIDGDYEAMTGDDIPVCVTIRVTDGKSWILEDY